MLEYNALYGGVLTIFVLQPKVSGLAANSGTAEDTDCPTQPYQAQQRPTRGGACCLQQGGPKGSYCPTTALHPHTGRPSLWFAAGLRIPTLTASV